MDTQETFRRSLLTLAPCWGLAAGLAVTVRWAADHFGLLLAWEGLLPAALPLVWAAGRTLQWASGTWTATADGQLVVRSGVLFRSREAIPLRATLQAHVQPCLPSRWLDVGHLSLQAAGPLGQPRTFRWNWLARPGRLAAILRAQGQLPLGQPSPWQRAARPVRTLGGVLKTRRRPLGGAEQAVPGQPASGEEYQHFLTFCCLLLEGEGATSPLILGVPEAKARQWMQVLRQARIVLDAPGGEGWRLAGDIHSLDAVRRRIGEEELGRALQRPI